MNGFNWKNIISHNGSQNNAFEELVCQLAREEIANKESFYRIGTPDGGVEAYYILKNGGEYGWQAKFFDSMGQSQWRQLEDSFESAFEKHPHLVKYYICIPLDRADPRKENKHWFMDKWKEKVVQWQKYAREKGRSIDFEYWGSSELLHRLTLEKHAGRTKYWFNQMELSNQWIKDRIEQSVRDLGARYTPELNFELDIAKNFDFIARDAHFKRQIYVTYDDILKKMSNIIDTIHDKDISEYKEKLQKDLEQLRNTYENINFSEIVPIHIDSITSTYDMIIMNITPLERYIYDWRDSKAKHTKEDPSDKFDHLLYRIDELRGSLYDFEQLVKEPKLRLANTPALILNGSGGVGKSHLIADVALKRLREGKHSILLLGQHFVSNEAPWTQILRNILRLDCNEDEFLGALDSKAQSIGSRIIVFIDAINEGNGLYFWHDHIKSFIETFKKFKWLGLVLSIRSSYVRKIAPGDLITEDIAVRIEHYGFRDNEYEASKSFFKHYHIQQPSIPLLHPDFQNPLYLKLFCSGLEKKGLTTIPDGYEGITKVISFYLEGINDHLSRPVRFNYDAESVNLVKKATELIAQKRVENNLKPVLYEEACILIEREFNPYLQKKGFLDALISEGVFTKNLYWDKEGRDTEGIYLTYQRFEEHIITSYLIEKHLDRSDPAKSFSKGEILYELIKDEDECNFNSGIVEALSVQLPEFTGKELYEIAPWCKGYFIVIDAFLESLIWRKKETANNKLIDYINQYVIKYAHNRFWDTVLSVAPIPKHFFNANFLHKNLMRVSLPDRDAWWTTYIHRQIYERTPVKRLIDWAWSDEDKSHISDESILLSAMGISWFLTSSNRFLRDSATKALIALLENKIEILQQLLKEFEEINDPYVYERLFAVAYGCVLRTSDTGRIKDLSEYIYHTIFDREKVYPHILLRDYARGVIEYSLYLGCDVKVRKDKIAPPYKSDWFDIIPTYKYIEKYKLDYNNPAFKNYYWSQNIIIDSMQPEGTQNRMGMYGDFGRYVFQSGFSNWKLNVQTLSNIAVKRIFELGYDVEKHGEFDRNINRDFSYGRSAGKPERIGKKYQWIAFYELLARVSDNFPMYEDTWSKDKKEIRYEGPWNPYVRDIDPTILIKSTKENTQPQTSMWWNNVQYKKWSVPYEKWIKIESDLPNPTQIIQVADPSGKNWLLLEAYLEWEEPVGIGEDRYEQIHKHIWYLIKSYIVKEEDYEKIVKWCKKKHFMGRWMPESRDLYQVFDREYYWSQAYKFFGDYYWGGEDWSGIIDREKDEEIGKVMVTAEQYLWEEEYDCSKKGTITYLKPVQAVFKGLGMKFGPKEGELLNERGQCVCFDPSVWNVSPMCLLVCKDSVNNFLKKNNLRIFWTVLGEKWVRGGGISGKYPSDRLEFSGVYTLDGEQVDGRLKFFSEKNR